MNKKNNRKGFTIVELVIVIAVIAILATVLVPTFGNVIKDANDTALLQEVKNEYTNYTIKYATSEDFTEDLFIKIDGNYYVIEDGAVKVSGKAPVTGTPAGGDVIYDAANDEAGHKFEAKGGDGADKDNCKTCNQVVGDAAHK